MVFFRRNLELGQKRCQNENVFFLRSKPYQTEDDKVSAYWLISNYISMEENSTAVHFELIDGR